MRKGFNLIEISIALLILGVLAGITLPLLLQTNRAKKIELTKGELQTYKARVITYYNLNRRIPPHPPSYLLPHLALQIPRKFTFDPVSGIPYRYFADTTADNNYIYVDDVSIGDLGAVIISAGPNGKFDGENASPNDKRFQSTGSGDFDDILVSVSQNELLGPDTTCTSYGVTIRNSSGATIYVFPTKSASTYTTLNNGGTLTLSNVNPDEYFLLSTSTQFTTVTTNAFTPRKYDRNGNCRVYITITTRVQNVPVLTIDQD